MRNQTARRDRAFGALVVALTIPSLRSALAEEFSWELTALRSGSEIDDLFESDRAALEATYYFGAVDDTIGPVALAAFLDPKSRVSLAVSRQEQTTEAFAGVSPVPITLPDLTSEARDYTVRGRYVLPASKWYFGGAYGKGELDDPPELQQSADMDSAELHVGKYLGSTTTLALALRSTEHKAAQPFFVAFTIAGSPQGIFNAGTLTLESTTDTARVEAEHVGRLGKMSYRLSGNVGTSSAEVVLHRPSFTLPALFPPFLPSPPAPIVVPASTTETDLGSLETYSIAGELFPTTRIGARVGYVRADGETADGDAYDIGVTWFVRHDLGLDFGVSRQKAGDSPLGDSDGAVVRLVGRL
jgi:hypothetical protein